MDCILKEFGYPEKEYLGRLLLYLYGNHGL